MNLVVCFLVAISTNLQNIVIKHFSVNNGLPTNICNSVCTDNAGYLWLATNKGLVKYDGYAYTYYQTNSNDSTSIPNNICRGMFVDKLQNHWVITSKGLSLFDDKQEIFSPIINFENFNYKIKNDSTIWLLGDEVQILEFCTTDRNDKIILDWLTIHGDQFISTVECQNDTIMWVAIQNEKIYKYITTQKRIENIFAKDTFEKNRHFLLAENDQTLWAANENVCKRVTFDKTFKHYTINTIQNGKGCVAFLTDSLICFGTNTGFGIYNIGNKKTDYIDLPNLDDGIVQNFMGNSLEDLWIVTTAGLYHLTQKQHFTYYAQKNLSDEIWSVFKDENLWVGTETSFNKMDLHKNSSYAIPVTRKQNDKIRAIQPAKGNKLWLLAQFDGLQLFNKSTHEIEFNFRTLIEPFAHIPHYSMLQTEDKIYIGTNLSGVIVFDKKTMSYEFADYKYYHVKSNLWVICLAEGFESQSLILGTWENGLYQLNKTTQRMQKFELSAHTLASYTIFDIKKLPDNTLFIATDGNGVLHINQEKILAQYTTENGLCDNVVYALQLDDFNNIWCATNNGLGCINLKIPTIQNYSIADGLPSNEFSLGSGFQTQNGEIFFGTTKGLVSFQPQDITDAIPPQIQLTDLFLFGKKVPLQDYQFNQGLRFQHYENFITLRFTALHLKNPEKNQYAYKINQQKDWVYLGNEREIVLPKQAPGKYTIFIKAANADGVWTPEPYALKMYIIPPIWKRIEFYIFLILICLALGRFYHRSKIKKALELQALKFRERDETRQKLAFNFHDDMGGMFSDLLWKCRMLEKKLKDSHYQIVLSTIIKQAENCYTEMRHFLWQINPEKDTLYELLVQINDMIFDRLPEYMAFEKIEIDPAYDKIFLSMQWRREIFYIFKEAMTNTIKHANAYRITFTCELHQTYFSISFTDNGSGFLQTSQTQGVGMTAMRQRGEQMGGHLEIKSNPTNGTQIIFTAAYQK